jgi:thioredoxin family protein/AhpC/TSA family protein
MTYNRRQLLRAGALSLAAGTFGIIRSAKAKSRVSTLDLPDEGSFPSLAHATGWLNSQPLSPNQLRGKVVLVNFCTYTCINWLRSLPHVRAWAEKYKDCGLVVIGAHTPEFEFEKRIDNVRRAAEDMNIHYPIAIDNDYAIWRAFQNEYWPALYLIDAKGRIRHHQFGEGGYAQSELILQQLLQEAGASGVDRAITPVAGTGIEAPADWPNLRSPETYVGYERTQNFASTHNHRNYTISEGLKLNHWAVAGKWDVEKQNITLESPNGRIAFRFHARDLHLVMGPSGSGNPIRFRVSIDNNSPGTAHGTDIDEQGNGILRQSRLYQLVRQNSRVEDREFEIEFLEAGAKAFSFTFG